jgi:hypothetical protein
MPTVLRVDGFQFKVIPGDHVPPHVHVIRSGIEIKIDLSPVVIKNAGRASVQDLARAEQLTTEHQAWLLTAWEGINGKQ